MKVALLCTCILLVTWEVRGYPDGPPISSCTDMFPSGHNAAAQTFSPPYRLTLSSTTFVPGQNIILTLETTGNANYPYYEGMFVQARLANCDNNMPIGTFSIPTNDSFLRVMDCGSITASAVSHKTHTHETSKTFTWTAPNTYPGRIYFRATVVKNTATFWTNVNSAYVATASDNSTEPTSYCDTTGAASSLTAFTSLLLAAVVTSFAFF